MKKKISLFLILIFLFSLSACENRSSDKHGNNTKKSETIYALSEHKVDLNCPELENISRFAFNKMTKYEHCFVDENGIAYAINFEKPFYETKTNAKILKDECGYEFLLNLQASNNGWYEGSSYTEFLKSKGLDLSKTLFFEKAALMYDEKSLKIYEFTDTSESFSGTLETNDDFRLLKEFDENIVSINGCIIKTKSKYYAIEHYLVNADDFENYADVSAIYDWRITELDEEMFAIPMENIKFLYMPDSTSNSYFLIDKNNNCFFNKTYIGG